MERQREDYQHLPHPPPPPPPPPHPHPHLHTHPHPQHHRHHRNNQPDHQEQFPKHYQHEHQHHYFNRHESLADQNQDHQFNNHNHDNHSNYDTNHQLSFEPNEPFGGGVGGGFCSNARKRGRYHSGRAGSPDHNDDAVYAKLYVAPVPRTTTEEYIRPRFEEHGNVVEVIFPRDKWTGQQQGYCFVKYATIEEADWAIKALNDQYTVPGEAAPIKVRYADGERERLGKVERGRLGKGEREHPGGGEFVDKLYVGSINKQASKQEIEEIFSPYGHVEDVYIARDILKQSRGCAFIKFSHRDMAVAAMKALSGTFTMRGCDQPLVVRFADPKKRKTGELRGNYAFGGQNFGPCSHEPLSRPTPNFGDSMGGRVLPNASYTLQEISPNSQPQTVSHAVELALGAPHITEQSLPPVKQPPTQLFQMPLQQTQVPHKCLQSSQQAVSEMKKQPQNLEQHQGVQVTPESTWTESNPPAVSVTSATLAVPPSPQTVDLQECDWSEHACPDGYKYYYNCTTCESRWEKPDEFILFQQQLQKQQKPHNSSQQPHSLSTSVCGEEVNTQKDLHHAQIKSETSPVVDPTHL